jgi:hypothetical protein
MPALETALSSRALSYQMTFYSANPLDRNGIYDLTIGPVCFVIICEVSATKVRAKTIAIATAVQAVMGIVMTVAIPYMINPDQANMRGKLGFFFGEFDFSFRVMGLVLIVSGGLSLISFVWAYFRVPETVGRTYEELDIMFEKKLPTRAFKTYKVV